MDVLDNFGLSSGRVAVVMGRNRGLGRAFALVLGEAGASVEGLARDAAKTNEALQELRALGINVRGSVPTWFTGPTWTRP